MPLTEHETGIIEGSFQEKKKNGEFKKQLIQSFNTLDKLIICELQ